MFLLIILKLWNFDTFFLISFLVSLQQVNFKSTFKKKTRSAISIMKITIKQLQCTSECSLEVEPTTSVLEIKQQIEKKLNISTSCQRLLHLGKTLADEKNVSSYPAIKDGAKLNLAVKKPEGFYDVSLKHYKKMGLSDAEAAKAASRLQTVVKEKFEQLSWDDVDALSMDFLLVKDGKHPTRIEREYTEDVNGL